ncbi:hypothetical protein OJF2_69110 [Aquisphaera giovannonii]|uniref:Uncharacterized protein n=1 Tax=Aquisphaera giovannonii TaxID=406548 RepID=A0A5B9WEJ8_9BACT|nr:exodeoxyribonuclease VII large subunit [Aquisphaera giovannonii]QEH38310.1 hypothetical protein OJF2_69110 [Aquisphaera giovannonii]
MNRTIASTAGESTLHGTVPGGPGTDPLSWDWDRLHDLVQQRLGRLRQGVLAEEPAARCEVGRTSTPGFPLFSCLAFYHLDGGDFDPIVAGLTIFRPAGDVRVEGELSGDESGHVYFDDGCTLRVAAEPGAVERAVVAIADRLADQSRIVIDAIRRRIPQAVER